MSRSSGRPTHYDVADRARALECGGIGAIHLMCLRTGLVEAINRKVEKLAQSR